MQTATNPQTGERLAFVDGEWVPVEQTATNPQTGQRAWMVRGQWITDEQPMAPVEAQRPRRSPLVALGQGATAGIAGVVGAPVDIINIGLGAIGLGTERPILGARHLREMIGRIPTPGGVPLTYTGIEEVPEEHRALARAGEVIGGAAPFAAAPFAVRRAIERVPEIFRPIVRAARERPRRFATAEVGGTVGAATGAGAAELAFPGDPTAALVGEVAGGFLNPTAALARFAPVEGVQRVARSYTRAGREEAAAKAIQDVMIAAGEDPQRVAATLRQADVDGVSLTAGQRAQSPTLLALERTLTGKNPDFDRAMRQATSDNIARMRDSVEQLRATGDPNLLREAARLRNTYFNRLLQDRFDAAQARMQAAAARLGGDPAAASVQANQILEESMKDARAAERALWAKVPRDQPLDAQNTAGAYDNFMAGSYAERPTPPSFISNFVQRTSETGATSGELISFRSDMLARARDQRAQKNWVEARIYEDMADGALADLAAMPGPEMDEARNFSRQLNDVFSRTFAADAMAVTRTGEQRIMPEAVLQRAFGSGGTLANARFAELEQAAQFTNRSMIHEQEDFLRAAARTVVDPATGRINARQLEGFLRENNTMLQRYPALRRELADASAAEQAFRQVESAGKASARTIEQRAAFSEVLRQDNPANAIHTIMNSAQPSRGFGQLARLARRGPPGAVDGLKASTLDYATHRATSAAGDFSFARFREILTTRAGGRPGMLELMQQHDVISKPDADRLRMILRDATKIERALALKGHLGETVTSADAMFDLVVRAVGANIGGSSILSQGTGAPLVMAGAGVRAARNLFEKMPATRVTDVMIEAARNPAFMAVLLEKPQTPQRARELTRQVNAFLLQAGLTLEPVSAEPIDQNEHPIEAVPVN